MSRLPFEWFLAFRYLRPKRTFVSVITLISIVGVTLGVAVLIIVISVMSGFDRDLRKSILGFKAHLTIQPRRGALNAYENAMSTVMSNRLVQGVAPFILGQVWLETQPDDQGDARGVAPWLRGIDPRWEGRISVLPQSVVEGRFDVADNGLLIGRELARSLGIEAGDRVAINSPRHLQRMRLSRQQGGEEAILAEEFVVRGVFGVGYYEYDASFIVTSLANAQELFELQDGVNGLLVMIQDPFQADQVQTQLRQALGPEFRITTWSEDNAGILNALLVEKNVMFYILFFIMIVAAFGIASALITFVVQKTREIGTLKALGATSSQVMWLFVSQSLVVGVLGVCCGFGLGLLAVTYRNPFLHFMRSATGLELFPADIYQFNELPAILVPADIAVICGGSLLICLLAGVLPAWNAGRLRPVEALRHE